MKKIIAIVLAAVLVLVLAVVIFGTVSLTSSSSGDHVSMQLFFFHPKTLNTTIGTTVTWTNKDLVRHNIIGEGWGSGDLGRNETYSHTFTQAGTYSYHCSHHFWMKAVIVVK